MTETIKVVLIGTLLTIPWSLMAEGEGKYDQKERTGTMDEQSRQEPRAPGWSAHTESFSP